MTSALITCSGISKTGKLTTQVALTLLQRSPDQYVWIQAKRSAVTFETDIGDFDRVIVLDGCSDCIWCLNYQNGYYTPESEEEGSWED